MTTKEKKEKTIRSSLFVMFVVALWIIFIAVLPYMMEKDKEYRLEEKEDCYTIIGKDNITKETWDDWYYHAYRGDTLVCAHGKVSANGLIERYDLIKGIIGNGIIIEEIP